MKYLIESGCIFELSINSRRAIFFVQPSSYLSGLVLYVSFVNWSEKDGRHIFFLPTDRCDRNTYNLTIIY